MLSQALSQALPLHPHTCADLDYCSDTLVYVSCGLDLPVHGDEVHVTVDSYSCDIWAQIVTSHVLALQFLLDSIMCEYGCSTM